MDGVGLMTEAEKNEVRHTLKFMVSLLREGSKAVDELCLKYAIPKDGWKGECRRNGDRRMEKEIIKPHEIIMEQCPVFVSACDIRGFLGFGIRARTRGDVNHSMIMRRPGYFASQNLLYREVPLKRYVRPGVLLKFWQCVDITEEERLAITTVIWQDLRKPWWKRMYDFPGIVGQAVGLRWINIPWLNYCTEKVASRVRILIPGLRKKPTPEELDRAYELSPRFRMIGYYVGI